MITNLDTLSAASHTAPRIVARLLGGVDVRCDGVRIDTHAPPAALLVLAYVLAHAGKTLRRDDVAFELWPDASECDAKANLRRNLYVLQQSVPASFGALGRCDKKTITCFPEPAEVSIDVRTFEAASLRVDRFEEAAQTYGGEFAPRIDHPWACALRERLHGRAVHVLESLLAKAYEAQDDRSTLQYADRLLQIDPWREDIMCHMMQVRFRRGDRAGALHSYGTFRANLVRKLGVEPMSQTRSIYDRIRNA